MSLIRQFESESSPGRFYDVKRDDSNGRLWCSCPRWKFKRAGQPYHCKHTDMALPELRILWEVREDGEHFFLVRPRNPAEQTPAQRRISVPARPLESASTRLAQAAQDARRANIASAIRAEERTARPKPLGVPSLETVKRAAQKRASPDGVIVRTGRQRSDDE